MPSGFGPGPLPGLAQQVVLHHIARELGVAGKPRLVQDPRAIGLRIWSSRCESISCRGRSLREPISVAIRSASAGVRYFPPAATLRIAVTSESIAVCLLRYPSAPSLKARTA